MRQNNYRGKITVTSSGHQDAKLLKREGVDLVLIPYVDAAKEAVDQLMFAQ
ncbi:MAG: hypothetical protein IPI97_13320 [Nitrosomonas sp.]|nr:hypothetical protein [Nitrosomonas sp.]MBK7365922.1 hypothetical protein [Nitrosomonas sp.]